MTEVAVSKWGINKGVNYQGITDALILQMLVPEADDIDLGGNIIQVQINEQVFYITKDNIAMHYLGLLSNGHHLVELVCHCPTEILDIDQSAASFKFNIM